MPAAANQSAPRALRAAASACALIALAAAGCASPIPGGYFSGSRKVESELAAKDKAIVGDADAVANDKDTLKATALRKANDEPPQTQEQALAGVLKELAEIRAIDPAAEAQVMADLRDAKPEYYPLIVQQFRAALAYRQQIANRPPGQSETLAANDPRTAAAKLGEAADLLGNSRRADQLAAATGDRSSATPTTEFSPTISPAAAAQALLAASATMKAPTGPDNPGLAPRARAATSIENRSAANQSSDDRYSEAPTVRVLPPPALRGQSQPAPAGESDALVSDQATPIDGLIQPAAFTPSTLAASGDWHADLAGAIADLQKTVRPEPTTVDELHDHMRLRALMLLAGREDDAYQPIPGASPAQQDYWAKQLFAIDAYLDGAAGRDDRQRAASALVYLDQARAQLSELATLQLRNLSFVENVSGFGAYKPLKDAKFQPGQHVTVYAEVENFRSRGDAEGYHTTLGTSYQVLDKSGQRVDGAQFSDVVDVCRNRRRDFHMQYDLPLPDRIYAGEYQLELTVTDHTSNKIGVSKLRFEITSDNRLP